MKVEVTIGFPYPKLNINKVVELKYIYVQTDISLEGDELLFIVGAHIVIKGENIVDVPFITLTHPSNSAVLLAGNNIVWLPVNIPLWWYIILGWDIISM